MVWPRQILCRWEAGRSVDPFPESVSMWGELANALKVEARGAEVREIFRVGREGVETPDGDDGEGDEARPSS